MLRNQVTIKDIAAELGISPSTVSRALKDHPDISNATKKAVKELAEKWDYEPNSIALSLRSQKSNIIGVIVPQLVHHFFSTVISGIEDVAYSAGYNVMICQSNEKSEREVANIKALVSSRAEGLIVSFSKETEDFSHFQKLQKRGIPLVFFDRISEEMDTHSVIVDDFGGAFKATEHLIQMGRKRIAHLGGPDNLMISQNRSDGYVEALEQNKMKVDKSLIVSCEADESQLEAGSTGMKKLLSLKKVPDAVFANNDMVAIGAMRAIKEAGLTVPKDIAVIGYSDWPIASLMTPPLSSVAQPGYEMGKVAAEILINQIKNPGEEFDLDSKILETEVIARESTIN
ncbi:MAG: LacI family transcriptional regulator [Flammeovirgaceae bacterium]|jgi:LacI family transcriptional regulator